MEMSGSLRIRKRNSGQHGSEYGVVNDYYDLLWVYKTVLLPLTSLSPAGRAQT